MQVLKDSLEAKGFRCTKTSHTRKKVMLKTHNAETLNHDPPPRRLLSLARGCRGVVRR